MTRYTKQTWANGDPTKPVSAARLGHLETQFDRALETVAEDIADPDSDIRAELNTAIGALSGVAVKSAATPVPPVMTATSLVRVKEALAPGASGTWDDQNVGILFDIIWDAPTGQYVMLYCGYDGSTTTKFGRATSPDLLNWTKDGANPIFSPSGIAGQPDFGGITAPQFLRWGGDLYVYYAAFPQAGFEKGEPKIMVAKFDNGSAMGTLQRTGTIVLDPTTIPWANGPKGVIYRARPVVVGGKIHLWFNAGQDIGDEQIGMAIGDNPLGPFTLAQNTPIVTPAGLTGNGGNPNIVSDPELSLNGEWWEMTFWAGTSGLWRAYSHVSEYPLVWHKVPTSILYRAVNRPVWVNTPDGPLLFVNAGESTIDIYKPNDTARRPFQVRRRPMRQGRSYRTPGIISTSNTNTADGYITFTPLPIDVPTNLYSLSVNVTFANVGALRLGIYADNGEGRPGKLVREGVASPDASTTGVKTFSFGTAVNLPPGLYWLACVAQGANIQVTCIASATFEQNHSTVIADLFAATAHGWYTPSGGYASGALPSSGPTVAAASGAIPLVVATT